MNNNSNNYNLVCSNCKNPVAIGNSFCSYCGNLLPYNFQLSAGYNNNNNNNNNIENSSNMDNSINVVLENNDVYSKDITKEINDGSGLALQGLARTSLALSCIFYLIPIILFVIGIYLVDSDDYAAGQVIGWYFIFSIYFGLIPIFISFITGVIAVVKCIKNRKNVNKKRKILNVLNIISLILMSPLVLPLIYGFISSAYDNNTLHYCFAVFFVVATVIKSIKIGFKKNNKKLNDISLIIISVPIIWVLLHLFLMYNFTFFIYLILTVIVYIMNRNNNINDNADINDNDYRNNVSDNSNIYNNSSNVDNSINVVLKNNEGHLQSNTKNTNDGSRLARTSIVIYFIFFLIPMLVLGYGIIVNDGGYFFVAVEMIGIGFIPLFLGFIMGIMACTKYKKHGDKKNKKRKNLNVISLMLVSFSILLISIILAMINLMFFIYFCIVCLTIISFIIYVENKTEKWNNESLIKNIVFAIIFVIWVINFIFPTLISLVYFK